MSLRATCPPRLGRRERGNLLPIPEIASAGFVSLAMTEWGVILSRSSEGHKFYLHLL
jgi:hypothetical protein